MPAAAADTRPINQRQAWQHLALGLVTAAVTSLLISLIWSHLGLPDRPEMGAMAPEARPWGLARFALLAGPLMVFATSLALVGLAWLLPRETQPKAGQELVRRALRLDALSYLALPVFFMLPLAWRGLGGGFAALGLCYLGLATLKGGLLLRLWWRGFGHPSTRSGQALDFRGHLALWLALAVLLGALALWTDEAVSTASDEVGYLIFAHSLARHGTLDPALTLSGQEFKDFYWGRWSHDLGFGLEQVRGVLFPLILAPPYFLGGRLGVMLFYAGLLALLAGQLWAWLRESGLRPGPAALAAALTLSSAPVLLLSQQVFPDLPGMLLFVLGLRLLPRLSSRPWLAGLGLVVVVGLMAGLKSRLAPLSVGLGLVGLAELLAARLGWRRTCRLLGGAALAAILAARLLPEAWWPAGVKVHLDQAAYQMQRARYSLQPLVIFTSGLLFDQNFGLLLAAPALLLGFAGLPAALRRHARPCLHLLVPAVFCLALVCYTRWFQWYGGFAGPARFLAVLLPPSALFLGLCLQALERPWQRLAMALPAALGLIYTWLNLLAPQLRFSRPVGVNPLIEALQAGLRTELFHLLPSTFVLSPALAPWEMLCLVAWCLLGHAAWRRADERDVSPQPSPGDSWPLATQAQVLALLLAALGGVFLVLAKLSPPSFLEAEHMKGDGPVQYVEYAYPNFMRGMVLSSGQSLSGRIHARPGQEVLRVVARPGSEGDLWLKLDGRRISKRWQGKPWFRDIPLGGLQPGFHQIEVGWSACPGRGCTILLDRLELLNQTAPARD